MKTSTYVNQNGRVVCLSHGGHYLKTEASAYPSAEQILTPLDDWMMVPASMSASLPCEEC